VKANINDLMKQYERLNSASEIAYWTIREAIREGVIAPGERLIEVELSDELGMSRTPIRAALARLEVENLIKKVPGQGLIVPEISLQDLLELFDIRELLEGLAARRAAERMGDLEMEALRDAIARMRRAHQTGEIQDLFTISEQFHQMIRAGSKLARLEKMINLLLDSHRGALELFELAPERIEDAIQEHQALCESICSGDADGAEAIAREHTRNAARAQIIARHLEGRG
jgi:DNA-binding GntR family transcriptional regulator